MRKVEERSRTEGQNVGNSVSWNVLKIVYRKRVYSRWNLNSKKLVYGSRFIYLIATSMSILSNISQLEVTISTKYDRK